MFFAEAQIRVHLYGQPTDMRKYALTIVMQRGGGARALP
jgi:hypothetical protein